MGSSKRSCVRRVRSEIVGFVVEGWSCGLFNREFVYLSRFLGYCDEDVVVV